MQYDELMQAGVKAWLFGLFGDLGDIEDDDHLRVECEGDIEFTIHCGAEVGAIIVRPWRRKHGFNPLETARPLRVELEDPACFDQIADFFDRDIPEDEWEAAAARSKYLSPSYFEGAGR